MTDIFLLTGLLLLILGVRWPGLTWLGVAAAVMAAALEAAAAYRRRSDRLRR